MTIFIMLDTFCESVWVYAVQAKGYVSDAWLHRWLANDSATVGGGSTNSIFKTDTELAIIDLRKRAGRDVRGDAHGV